MGFWAVFVTNASEQFGTNLRATAATSIPNFVRGSLVPIAWCFSLVLSFNNGDMIKSFYYVGGGVMLITLIALYFAKETFGRDLDFYEKWFLRGGLAASSTRSLTLADNRYLLISIL